MTDIENTDPPTELPATAVPGVDETDPTPEGSDETSNASREAARYRRQLREAEAARDSLLEQVNGMRRAEISRQAADVLTDPADLWLDPEVKIEDMLDESGALDQEKVNAALAGVIKRHPSWQAQRTMPAPTDRPLAELRGGATPASAPQEKATWATFLGKC